MSVEQLIQSIKYYNPQAEFDLLRRCYAYGESCHQGQLRKSGDPYFSHCIETAKVLISLKLDLETICAGLLHDTIEDVDGTTEAKLATLFGSTIAALVQGVTNISQYPLQPHRRTEQRQAENYLKLLLATAKDVRVILIKLADRLHNMETLNFQPDEKRRQIAKETLEIYAPIAHRLGISKIKNRLEDLAFKHIWPQEYKRIARFLNQKLASREAYTDEMVNHIRAVLQQATTDATVYGRPKNIYSIYQKINEKGTPFEEIDDLIGVRVLVNRDIDCYTAIGAIHTRWRHVPERFKDFVSLPKGNGYQSIHSTILDHGRRIEIQVRTHQMQNVAEVGIAAHWLYKEGTPSGKRSRAIFQWLKQALEDIQELKGEGAGQFLRSIKSELFGHEVYVFTPKGDVVALPAGSTPIDFAYKIHTQVGNTCIGVEVNGMVVSLRYRLQNGDQVKINTNANSHPGRDWLRWVKTARARNKLKHWFKEKHRSESIELGKRLLQIELRRSDLELISFIRSESLLAIANQLGYEEPEEILQHIGEGERLASEIVNSACQVEGLGEMGLSLDHNSTDNTTLDSGKLVFQSTPLIELSQEDLVDSTRIMKCCRPIPGDEIIGYIRRGKGVSIHRAGCNRLVNEPNRLVDIEWKPADQMTFPVDIVIECYDRPGILGEITTTIAQKNINIREGKFGPLLNDRSKESPSYRFEGGEIGFERLRIEVSELSQLNQIMERIRDVEGVTRVDRQ